MSAHALFSPSSAHRWMRCPGSLAMEVPFPESDTDYSREGTAAHELASWTLEDGRGVCSAYSGRLATNGIEITDDMCDYVQVYVDAIHARVKELELAGAVVELMIEQRVNYERFIQQPDSFGTSDVIIIATWPNGESLIDVHDLKYGYRVVYADKNEQMQTYALGAIAEYDIAYKFTRVAMTIHMPRKRFVDTWECGIDELMEFAEEQRCAAFAARHYLDEPMPLNEEALVPSTKACEWCKAKATCPALRSFVEETVKADFDDLTAPVADVKAAAGLSTMEVLENNLAAVPMIEEWCKAQRVELERRLFDGEISSQFKLVQGKRGDRAWSDKTEAESLLKSMRLKIEEMYKMTIISPTAAEKLLAKKNPRRWARLKNLITQSEGPISVAPMSDKRDPVSVTPAVDDFADLPPESDLC